jgi:hypothetical protein
MFTAAKRRITRLAAGGFSHDRPPATSMPRITTRGPWRGHNPELLLAQVCLLSATWAASPPSACREVRRAERVARLLACKTFDQMAGELKA